MTSDADSIIGLYQRHAHHWDKNRARDLVMEKPWLDRFLALLSPRSSVLDLGCGSGEPIARYLIENGYSVTGVDSSPAMIGICKGRFPNQSWVTGDMRESSLNREFDGILAWDSFFHLCADDQRRMFPSFRRRAAPKAALMFTSGVTYGEAIGSYQGEPLYHASLDTAEYRGLLDDHGFRVVTHVVEDPTCGRHTIWLAQLE